MDVNKESLLNKELTSGEEEGKGIPLDKKVKAIKRNMINQKENTHKKFNLLQTSNLNENNFKSDGIARIIENALNDKNNRLAFGNIYRLRKKGITYEEIANSLNRLGIKSRTGKQYSKGSVKRLYDRFLKYFDPEANQFIEGEVEIKGKHISDIGYLTILESGEVNILTKFTPFKPFTIMQAKDKDFKVKTTLNILNSFSFAKERILVSNFLHTNNGDSNILGENYFPDLQNILLEKEDLIYERYLQIPHSIWPFVQEREPNISKHLPIESLIIASVLLTNNLKKHIEFSFEKLKRFQLKIIRTQRTYSTFAVVDSNALIEEDFIMNIDGLASSSLIKIYRAKVSNEEDENFIYIESRKNLLHQVQTKSKHYIAVDLFLYNVIKAVLPACKEKKFEDYKKAITIIKEDKTNYSRLIQQLEKEDLDIEKLYSKIINVLSGVNLYISHLDKAAATQKTCMIPANL